MFYRDNFFQDAQLDAHFSTVLYSIHSLFFQDPELTPDSFSLLNQPKRIHLNEAPDDDVLMQKAAGISGGVRYVPDSNGGPDC